MTREEIIRNLKYTMEKHKNDTINTFGTNISVMCKDILDYLDQEPCEDCISRKEAIKSAKNIYDSNSEMKAFCMIKMLQESPSIQPKPKTAKWQCVLRGDWIYEQCTFCGSIQDVRSNYCPDCGAQMEGSEDGKSI